MAALVNICMRGIPYIHITAVGLLLSVSGPHSRWAPFSSRAAISTRYVAQDNMMEVKGGRVV